MIYWILLTAYLCFTRGAIFGIGLTEKRWYKFKREDYIDYLIGFFFLEIWFIVFVTYEIISKLKNHWKRD